MHKVDILLATYNGSEYLEELLRSLLDQTMQDFSVIIRDDGSSDGTLEILDRYIKSYPDVISLVQDDLGNLGSSKTFMTLLEYSVAEYVMFCDQDDYWLSEKVELMLDSMLKLENAHGKDVPLLSFSDLTVVDEGLGLVNKSFWNIQKIDPCISSDWRKLLSQNVITGCTVIMNQSARSICLPFDLDYMMHDHWVGVKVARYGSVGFIKDQTVLYRQHDDNVVGAYRFGWLYIFNKTSDIKKLIKSYSIAAQYFPDITVFQLLRIKIIIILRRLMSSA